MNPDLVVEIAIRNPYQCRATGYIIGPDRILTSGHLGQHETVIKKGTLVEVWFEPESPGSSRIQMEAKVIWSAGELLDCAVLECHQIPGSKKQLSCRIRYEPLQVSLAFNSRVWCDAGMESNSPADSSQRRPSDVSGNAAAMSTGQEYFEVDCVNCSIPATEAGWKGASGGAVFVENELAGVIRRFARNFNGEKLLVVPICRLIEAEGFALAAGITQAEKEHHDQLCQQVRNQLPRRLKGISELADVWRELLCELNIKPLADEAETVQLVTTTLLNDPGHVVAIERILGRFLNDGNQDASNRLALVQDLLLPMWIDPGVRRRLYDVVATSGGIVVGTAASPVGAEQGAAHVQKRAAKWVFRNGEVEGAALFSLPSPVLKQPTIQSRATAFLRTLAVQVLGPSWYPAARQALHESTSGEVQPGTSVEVEWAQYRKDLPGALDAISERGSSVPYCAMKLDSDDQTREDQLAMLRMVKEVVPNFLIFEICQSDRPNPQEVRIATWIRGRFIGDNS